MNKNCGIYKITSPTGRVYIGQSKNLKRRFKEYSQLKACSTQRKLYRSLTKYSPVLHQFDIIEYCDEAELNCSERFWQDEFDVLGKNGLNCLLTECGGSPRIYSEEYLQKASDNFKGAKNPMYGKKGELHHSYGKVGELNPLYGKPLTEDHKDKLRVPRPERRGENNPSWGKKGELCHNYGLKRSDETKEKLSIIHKKRFETQECIFSKKVIDIVTGQIYKSIKAAATALGYNYPYLTQRLKGIYPNNTNLRYYTDEQDRNS